MKTYELMDTTLNVLGPSTTNDHCVTYRYLEFIIDGKVVQVPPIIVPHVIDAGLRVGAIGDFYAMEIPSGGLVMVAAKVDGIMRYSEDVRGLLEKNHLPEHCFLQSCPLPLSWEDRATGFSILSG